jgi:hypothetical protein
LFADCRVIVTGKAGEDDTVGWRFVELVLGEHLSGDVGDGSDGGCPHGFVGVAEHVT